MVVVGIDVHKRTHTCVAVDEVGKKISEVTVPAVAAGHRTALAWAAQFDTSVTQWAVEDSRSLSVHLERDLLRAGQNVVRVPAKLMAGVRSGARTVGKSDPIDALAVARVALREPDLPAATVDEDAHEMKLLVDFREALVGQRTSLINSLRGRVHQIAPERFIKSGILDRPKQQKILAHWLEDQAGLLAELALAEAADVIALTIRINDLHRRIAERITELAPTLLELPGCAELTAAKIYGETAGITRFASDAKFAHYAGTAPIPVWSGNTAGRVRLNRSGNRQLNAALHRIAMTQARIAGPGKDYYDKKVSSGKGRKEALRSLKRHLARITYRHLATDHHNQPKPTPGPTFNTAA